MNKFRRKKFESPQQPPSTLENPFSARGAIRRQSLRDRSGMSLARLEAQREGSDLIRSYNSKEDLSSNPAVCFCFFLMEYTILAVSVARTGCPKPGIFS